MRSLGLINARGGSKGIPGKNIKLLNGKPLISYSINAALNSKLISRIVVSTDSQEIADVALKLGADVPFLRPKSLASDTALQIDAIIHAMQQLESSGDFYDAVILLQPTCPLRTASDIDNAITLMQKSCADTVISVTKIHGQHPVTMYVGDPKQKLSPLVDSDKSGVIRQEFSDVYWRNGAIYAIRRDVIMVDKKLYGPSILGYEMPDTRSANIDEPIDWIVAEALLRHNLEIDK